MQAYVQLCCSGHATPRHATPRHTYIYIYIYIYIPTASPWNHAAPSRVQYQDPVPPEEPNGGGINGGGRIRQTSVLVHPRLATNVFSRNVTSYKSATPIYATPICFPPSPAALLACRRPARSHAPFPADQYSIYYYYYYYYVVLYTVTIY